MKLSPIGASLEPEPDEARLDLGELHQVLEDEELARKLQEEEDKLLRRVRDSRFFFCDLGVTAKVFLLHFYFVVFIDFPAFSV